MLAAVADARDAARGHEAVVVSHQLPVWTVAQQARGPTPLARPAQARVHARLADLADLPRRRARLDHLLRAGRRAAREGEQERGRLMDHLDRRTALRWGAVAMAGGLVTFTAACSTDPNSVADQARSGDRKGYVAGDGSIEQLPVTDRGEPVKLEGTTLEGKPWSSAERAGTVLVVNVWGSWCPPCIEETPALQKAWESVQAKGKKVEFIGLDKLEGPETGARLPEGQQGHLPLARLRRRRADPLPPGQGLGHARRPSCSTTQARIAARVSGPVTDDDAARPHRRRPRREGLRPAWYAQLATGSLLVAAARRPRGRVRLVRLALRAAARARLPRLRHRPVRRVAREAVARPARARRAALRPRLHRRLPRRRGRRLGRRPRLPRAPERAAARRRGRRPRHGAALPRARPVVCRPGQLAPACRSRGGTPARRRLRASAGRRAWARRSGRSRPWPRRSRPQSGSIGRGLALAAVYSIGLGLPFVLMAAAVGARRHAPATGCAATAGRCRTSAGCCSSPWGCSWSPGSGRTSSSGSRCSSSTASRWRSDMRTETPPRPTRRDLSRTPPCPGSARGGLRWAWRQLTSMRTALFLLLLLSIAAVPGLDLPAAQHRRRSGRRLHRAEPHDRRRGSTGSASSTSTRRRGSRRSTCCSSSPSSAASCRAPRCTCRALRSTPPRAPARLKRLDEHAEVVDRPCRPTRRSTPRGRCCGASGSVLHSHDATSVSARVRLPARDRQPALPPRAHGHHHRHGRRAPARLARRHHPRRGRQVRVVRRHLQHDLARTLGRHRDAAALRPVARQAPRRVQRDPGRDVRHAARSSTASTTLQSAPGAPEEQRERLGQPPDHRRRRRHLPARQRLHPGHHGARREGRRPLPRGDAVPPAGRATTARSASSRCRRPRRSSSASPASSCRRPSRPSPTARCRSSPTPTTPRSRCRSGRATSSPVAHPSRSTRSTPSEMKQVPQARRVAGPVSASSPARPTSCPAAAARSPSTASSASRACRCAPTRAPRSASSAPSSPPSASSSASRSSAAASSSASARPRRAPVAARRQGHPRQPCRRRRATGYRGHHRWPLEGLRPRARRDRHRDHDRRARPPCRTDRPLVNLAANANAALYASMIVYTLAMLAFTWHLAARAPQVADSTAPPCPADERARSSSSAPARPATPERRPATPVRRRARFRGEPQEPPARQHRPDAHLPRARRCSSRRCSCAGWPWVAPAVGQHVRVRDRRGCRRRCGLQRARQAQQLAVARRLHRHARSCSCSASR